ncbi:hypothetical protein [Microbispora triticiradicis]|uniref:hypothetical protein n=1 Tax=Microbispora triticiradicis TaxID=2200763 RepID=UPI001AD7854E|nr:hypothetical protein [Microbispora triticiradicis]MBO4274277.1 hypothetical protein [Microbispora triticiradicis]
MASVRHEIVIDAPPEHIWDVLRDVGAVHERLLPGRVTDIRIRMERGAAEMKQAIEAAAHG